ncbi:MAG: hypothetical protein EBR34_08640 [Sphingomonadaceae bacterium]|nr:hypothetical protein [Sphingomonadaceae bacterium]
MLLIRSGFALKPIFIASQTPLLTNGERGLGQKDFGMVGSSGQHRCDLLQFDYHMPHIVPVDMGKIWHDLR